MNDVSSYEAHKARLGACTEKIKVITRRLDKISELLEKPGDDDRGPLEELRRLKRKEIVAIVKDCSRAYIALKENLGTQRRDLNTLGEKLSLLNADLRVEREIGEDQGRISLLETEIGPLQQQHDSIQSVYRDVTAVTDAFEHELDRHEFDRPQTVQSEPKGPNRGELTCQHCGSDDIGGSISGSFTRWYCYRCGHTFHQRN